MSKTDEIERSLRVIERNSTYGINKNMFEKQNKLIMKKIESSPDPVLYIVQFLSEHYTNYNVLTQGSITKPIFDRYEHLINVILTQGALHLKAYIKRNDIRQTMKLSEGLFSLLSYAKFIRKKINIQKEYEEIIIGSFMQYCM